MAQNDSKTSHAGGDVICADMLRLTTALQAAVYERMDGRPWREAMTRIVFNIVTNLERLERLQ